MIWEDIGILFNLYLIEMKNPTSNGVGFFYGLMF